MCWSANANASTSCQRSRRRSGPKHQGLWALVLDWGIRIFGFCIGFYVWFMASGELFRAWWRPDDARVGVRFQGAHPGPPGAVPPSGTLFLLVSGYVTVAVGCTRAFRSVANTGPYLRPFSRRGSSRPVPVCQTMMSIAPPLRRTLAQRLGRSRSSTLSARTSAERAAVSYQPPRAHPLAQLSG
jgi:hypothetical protein